MNIFQLLFGAKFPERKPAKKRRATKRRARFVPGEMQQRVRMVAPDVVEWSLVRKKRSKK